MINCAQFGFDKDAVHDQYQKSNSGKTTSTSVEAMQYILWWHPQANP